MGEEIKAAMDSPDEPIAVRFSNDQADTLVRMD